MRKTRIAIFAITAIFVLAIWYSVFAENVFYEWAVFFSPYVKDSAYGAVTFVFLCAISAMISPFSTAPLVPIAIVIWGPFITAMMLLLGWIIGGLGSYFVGKKFGYGLAIRLISREKIDKWARQIDGKVSIFMLLVFRIMTPSETGYIFGILRYPFWKYTTITVLSEIPFAFGLSYAGSAILSKEKEIFFILGACSFVFILVTYIVYRREFKKAI